MTAQSVLEAMQSAMEKLEGGDAWEIARSLLLSHPEGKPPLGYYQLVGISMFRAEKFDLAVRFLLRELSLHQNNLPAVELLWLILEQCHLAPKKTFTYELLSTLLRKEGLVIEVGSCYGRGVKFFLDSGFSVVSIEPRKEWCDLQKIVFAKEINDQRLIVQEYGCSSNQGERALFLSNDLCHIFSSLQLDWRTHFLSSFMYYEATEFVEVRPLSDLLINLSERAEAVILDCEGEELRVAGEILQNTPDERLPNVLVINFHVPYSTPHVVIETGKIGLANGFSRARFITDWWQVTYDEGYWATSLDNIDTSSWTGISALNKWQHPNPTLILQREN